MADIIPLAQKAPGIPSPEQNASGFLGRVSEVSLAREILNFHDIGLRARRQADLTTEKYFLHLDGEGNAQWYDLHYGTRLRIPTRIGNAPRFQDNQLRPITDNWVSHLTGQDYRFIADARPDRESRERALIDQAIINHQVRDQDWNVLWKLAKYTAACAGWCPVHAMWRDDQLNDPFEAVLATDEQGNPLVGPRKGMIDNWVGNPLDTVLDGGARFDSIFRATYGRILPADLVRQAFGRDDLEGSDRLPSAANFQRMASRWLAAGGQVHGTAVHSLGRGNMELIALIYDEVPPRVLADYPNGRLCVIALQGSAETRRDAARGSGRGHPELLWCNELPGKRLSFVPVMAKTRWDNPTGKAFLADLDDDQIHYNQLESIADEYLVRASKPPLGSTGPVNIETLSYRQDVLIELEDQIEGGGTLQYLEYPSGHIRLLESKIERVLAGMYRKGGWQAASRGEADSGQSGKAIISLQQADDSIFGTDEKQCRRELERFAGLNHALFRSFLDVPMVVDLVGDDLAHLAEPYVDRTMLSEDTPAFRLVSGWGSSPMARAQQILNLMGIRDAKGRELIDVPHARRIWPDPSLFSEIVDPDEVRERRPRVVNARIQQAAKRFRQFWEQDLMMLMNEQDPVARLVLQLRMQFPQVQQIPDEMGNPVVQMAAKLLMLFVHQRHPVLMDDDIEANLGTLSMLTQDETEDALVRQVAVLRQDVLWRWLAQKQQATAAQQGRGPSERAEGEGRGAGGAKVRTTDPGSSEAQSMVQADRQFSHQARSA